MSRYGYVIHPSVHPFVVRFCRKQCMQSVPHMLFFLGAGGHTRMNDLVFTSGSSVLAVTMMMLMTSIARKTHIPYRTHSQGERYCLPEGSAATGTEASKACTQTRVLLPPFGMVSSLALHVPLFFASCFYFSFNGLPLLAWFALVIVKRPPRIILMSKRRKAKISL
uniref:Uncharacterized protein n=1 Tax=Anopheles melas TaxID=34690 RepID=A0A182UIL7_9DIPT